MNTNFINVEKSIKYWFIPLIIGLLFINTYAKSVEIEEKRKKVVALQIEKKCKQNHYNPMIEFMNLLCAMGLAEKLDQTAQLAKIIKGIYTLSTGGVTQKKYSQTKPSPTRLC